MTAPCRPIQFDAYSTITMLSGNTRLGFADNEIRRIFG